MNSKHPSPFQIYAPVPYSWTGRYADYCCPDCGVRHNLEIAIHV